MDRPAPLRLLRLKKTDVRISQDTSIPQSPNRSRIESSHLFRTLANISLASW
jgi:hypothetical protein